MNQYKPILKMNRTEIIYQLKNVIISVLNHDNFEMNEELTASDISGWDSLSHMLIITKIEDDFQIKFKLKELNKLSNLGNLIDLIEIKLIEN
jgi:acyl carrier protein